MSDRSDMTDINKLLLENIKKNSPCYSIYTADGNKVGEIPHLLLLVFGYFNDMLSMNFFKDPEIKPEIILLEDYTEEIAKFFCKIIPDIYFKTTSSEILELKNQELIWFFKICGDYCMDQSIMDNYLIHIADNNLNWVVFTEIIKLYSSKSFKELPDLPVWKIFQKTKDKLLLYANTDPILALGEIPSEIYTYAIGRNFICDILEKCNCDNETILFSTIVDKIIKINDSGVKKLSLKAVYDLLSKIRWFFVRQDSFADIWGKLTEHYPEIIITKQINFAFKSRVTNNKLDTICYYNNKFKEFPPRSGLEYEKVIGNNSHMSVYTTTIKNPIHIQFAISRKFRTKTPACIKIECLSPIDKLPGSLVANFNIILLDHKNNIMSTKNQIWTFHNYFKLKFTDFENRFSNFKVQFCKIYFIENTKVTDIITNTEAIKKID